MAILNLPNGSSYDEVLTFEEQTREAQEYVLTVLDLAKDDSLDVMDGGRFLTTVHKNITDGFKVTYTREYIHPNNHRCSGAVKKHNYTLTTI